MSTARRMRRSARRLMSTHAATVQVETTTRGGSGGAIRGWATVGGKAAAPCRWRPLSVKEINDQGKQGMQVDCRFYFYDNPHVDRKNRILVTDAAGVQHDCRVKKVWTPHNLDSFWKVDCLERRDLDNPAA